MTLRPPFPWFGGKGRWAAMIIDRLGDVEVYAEPFAGSLAVLLAAPPRRREIVCDTSGAIVTAWRAIQHDPLEVARWADYPTFHTDLIARRRWLASWLEEATPLLAADMDYYDARAAGLWVWALSCWIGGPAELLRVRESGEMSDWIPYSSKPGGRVTVQRETMPELTTERRPHVHSNSSGQGVQVQRGDLATDRRPLVAPNRGGIGVSAQRLANDSIPHAHHPRGVMVGREDLTIDGRPYVTARGGRGVQAQCRMHTEQIPKVGSEHGGQGVTAQRQQLVGRIGTGARLMPWLEALAERLSRVVVLNRDWSSAVTPTLLQHSASSRKPPVGVFLDPPYLLGERSKLYESDAAGDQAARDSWAWAVEHGDTYRIAYACHAGDFELPDGWEQETMTFAGHNIKQDRMDAVLFSPACQRGTSQGRLL